MQENIPKNVLNFFMECNQRKIVYCHWKSMEHLLKGMIGKTDLDVLFDIKQRKKINEILISNNYVRVKSHKWNTYDNVEDWIGFDQITGIQTHMHLHYNLITGKENLKEQTLPWVDIVLENRVFNHEYNMWVCNPNIEIIIFITRIFIKRFDFKFIPINEKPFKLSAPEKAELNYMKNIINTEDVKTYANLMFSKEIADSISAFVNKDIWSNNECRRLKKQLVGELKTYRIIKSKTKIIMISLYRFILQRLRKKLNHPINKKKKSLNGGKLIAFLGVDGSGKTTIAKEMQKWFSWKIDCRYIYLGSGQGKGSLLNRILRKYANKKASKQINVNKENNKIENKPGLKYGIKKVLRQTVLNMITYSNVCYKKKMIKKINKMKDNGIIILTDRFPQNSYIGINDGPSIKLTNNTFFDIINKFLQSREHDIIEYILKYSPDVIVKMKIPFEVSRERKQDSSEESIRRKIEIVNKLHYEGADEYEVDSSVDVEETKVAVKQILFKYI